MFLILAAPVLSRHQSQSTPPPNLDTPRLSLSIIKQDEVCDNEDLEESTDDEESIIDVETFTATEHYTPGIYLYIYSVFLKIF